MIQLKDDEFIKLAEITGVPLEYISTLYDMHLLHEVTALDIIIKHDYQKMRKMGRYTPSMIMTALQRRYSVSMARVKSALYKKFVREFFCEKCDRKIPRYEYKRNEGICDNCKSFEIEF